MSKQEPSQPLLPDPENVEGVSIKSRYYVQPLTEQIFLVRECLSVDGIPGSDDHIVRSFNVFQDAQRYASSLNNAQGNGS